ncbi:aminopeptidase O-like isoform X1 [Mytilus californianus]|uniref:aminopeptidase O-like isoform X1 n=1 Tax=Mytilus californianus TaxID=6549 RepID=UPI002246B7DD|nr:aminopeptidase O-like isoform X1 [Mytilus californianus]
MEDASANESNKDGSVNKSENSISVAAESASIDMSIPSSADESVDKIYIVNIREEMDNEKDLPLMSNVKDIHISHYILQLKCLMETREMIGHVTLFRCCDQARCRECTKNRTFNQKVTANSKCSKIRASQEKKNKFNIQRIESEHNYIDVFSETTMVPDQVSKSLSDHSYNCADMICAQQSSLLNAKHSSASCNKTSNMQSINSVNVTDYADTGISLADTLENSPNDFKMILDCCDIEVDYVEELDMPLYMFKDLVENNHNKSLYENLTLVVRTLGKLKWEYGKHSVSVWKEGVKTESHFPGVIRIHYRTKPTGQSLKWTLDQDEKWCVFTHGHWINNRSFFPSQDSPAAMATWQAEIEVQKDLTIVMGGDYNEMVSKSDEDGWKKEYFNSRMEMPSSTLSLAIGYWGFVTIPLRYKKGELYRKPCRVVGPKSILCQSITELRDYIPVCLGEVNNILGPYPFPRLDVLIVPPCFDSLGMASPCVIYIAQSLLAGDCSMFVRIAHEICHSWFGLVIGPKDWTEEWLTEGFCTYVEDILHLNVKQEKGICDASEAMAEKQLRMYLKYKTLQNELLTTSADLQTLRPNKDNTGATINFVKDGMNPDKRFLQVHYLKGYFLLCYLESFVGLDKFLRMLHSYVITFYKELVSSKDVISFIFNVLPELRDNGLTEEKVLADWLDKPGMPEALKVYGLSEGNVQLQQVKKQVSLLRMSYPTEGSRKRKRKLNMKPKLEDLAPLQLVLFLEILLEDEKIPANQLVNIRTRYHMMSQNADVQHRWCELVIKHKVQKFYQDLREFLLNHQAMGVYLYGEMVLSGCKQQKKLAEECFNTLKDHMEPDPYSTVKSMVYGT